MTTTVCFYEGTADSFAADAASAGSKQGAFVPATSGEATLNAALAAGYIVKVVAPAKVTVVQGTNVSNIPGFIWTLANQ